MSGTLTVVCKAIIEARHAEPVFKWTDHAYDQVKVVLVLSSCLHGRITEHVQEIQRVEHVGQDPKVSLLRCILLSQSLPTEVRESNDADKVAYVENEV